MLMLEIEGVSVPADVHTLEGFRAWYAALGEGGPRAAFVDGDVFVEMSPQDYLTHEPVVRAINETLIVLVRALGTGIYYTPPSWITCKPAKVSSEPDGFFASYETLRAGTLKVNEARPSELVGRPDFVLEAVSRSSTRKDRVRLRAAYAAAGIPEYWIADGRKEALKLAVLALGPGGVYHQQAVDADGFVASPAWGRAFRLRRIVNPAGLSDIQVDVRDAS